MKDVPAVIEQIIGDDPPVTAPPDGLRAHDRATPISAKLFQPRQPTAELFREGIVGIIVEALVGPKAVDLAWNGLRFLPPTA